MRERNIFVVLNTLLSVKHPFKEDSVLQGPDQVAGGRQYLSGVVKLNFSKFCKSGGYFENR